MAQTQKREVLFDRFMSAKFLSDNAEWGNCTHQLVDNTHLSVAKIDAAKPAAYERIFRLPLSKKFQDPGKVEDLEVSLKVGLEYPERTEHYPERNELTIMLANDKPGNDKYALGFVLLNPADYSRRGPYAGIEGVPGDQLETFWLYDDKKYRVYDVARLERPRHYSITIKPLEHLAACDSALGNGHLFTVNYDTEYSPTVGVDSDLFLDVYRTHAPADTVINFVKATVTVLTSE